MRLSRLASAPVVAVCLFMFGLSGAFAQPQPITDSWKSPSGKLEAFVQDRLREGQHQPVLMIKGDDASRSPLALMEVARHVEVMFSPDDSWIAVNDYMGSNVARLRMFKRQAGLSYREEAEPTVADRIVQFAKKIETPQASQAIERAAHDHFYIVAVALSSQSLLVKMWGRGTEATVDDWYCVYDLAAQKATLDLAAMNRATIRAK